MIPVPAPPIIERGIVVFCPKLDLEKYLLKIEIFYSLNNAKYTWLKCDRKVSSLWSRQTLVEKNPVLFIYRRDELLNKGFYQIKISAYSKGITRTGSKTIGMLTQSEKIIVGLKYSIYSAIELS